MPSSHTQTPKPRDDGATREDALRKRREDLLDEALEETFPASDPIAPARVT